ncbi:short chain dehydrogenase family protein [Mycobacterium xenopi 4042]|uniref:Short chain dehydrogenase family protein n=1 Tax=Mycobacterium xenopi 4042 TaxID=1299334 RepID=X7ZWT2_MYCXE|nr:short chain dehydrogenase family protein [Mycobacterium xenopi 4042]
MRDRSLKDRVVVVTGASRGIGREIAVRVAADGARVALIAKTDAPHPKITGTLAETAEAVRAAGGQPLPVKCDVRDADAVGAAIGAVAEKFGAIDVVVNNAGPWICAAPRSCRRRASSGCWRSMSRGHSRWSGPRSSICGVRRMRTSLTSPHR